MKILSVFLLCLATFQAHADESNYWLARVVNTSIDVYRSSINGLESISNIFHQNEDERIERDLALCELIGESDRNGSALHSAIGEMINHIKDIDDRKFLDRKNFDVLRNNVALKGFCIKSYKGKYRDIIYLQSSFNPIRQDFEELRPVIAKYLATSKSAVR